MLKYESKKMLACTGLAYVWLIKSTTEEPALLPLAPTQARVP